METMTVKQLKEKLADIPDDMPVVAVDSYEVCFPIRSTGVGATNMKFIESTLTGAIGCLNSGDGEKKRSFLHGQL